MTFFFMLDIPCNSRYTIHRDTRYMGGIHMIDKGYISGSTRLLVLNVLQEKACHGYEIIKVLKLRSNDVFDMKEGTLYPILHKLENDEYIISKNEMVNGRMRKVYHITDKGVKVLAEEKAQWKEFSSAVNQVIAFGG